MRKPVVSDPMKRIQELYNLSEELVLGKEWDGTYGFIRWWRDKGGLLTKPGTDEPLLHLYDTLTEAPTGDTIGTALAGLVGALKAKMVGADGINHALIEIGGTHCLLFEFDPGGGWAKLIDILEGRSKKHLKNWPFCGDYVDCGLVRMNDDDSISCY